MDRVKLKMEGWQKIYESLHAEMKAERRQREQDKREREEERAKEQERMKQMQRQISWLEDKIDELENRSRRSNLVIKGIPEEKGESWIQSECKVQELLEKQLGVTSVEIVRAHRVGWVQGERPHPFVVKFTNEKEREQVMQAKTKLKSTQIYIDEDFSARLREERRQLFAVVRREGEQGRRARVRFNKVEIESQLYQWCKERQQLVRTEGGKSKNGERRGN